MGKGGIIMRDILRDMIDHPFRTLGETLAMFSIFALGYVALVMFA
jgi:hypothetical protein